MKPTISILVATYNGARHLRSQLDSLLDQSVQAVEIVVCDDCSSDNTPEILRRFADESPIPVHLIFNTRNKGYQRNFIDGVAHCSGDYVAFCDQDDVWLPNKLEALQREIQADMTPSLVFSNCLLVDENLTELGKTGFDYLGIDEQDLQTIDAGRLLDLLLQRPRVTGMTMLCHRQRLLNNSPPLGPIAHDYLISAAFAIGGDYRCVRQPLVLYRQHTSNLIGMQTGIGKKNRPTIGHPEYITRLNQDLVDKKQLLDYLAGVETRPGVDATTDQVHITDALTLVNFRLRRRTRFSALLQRIPVANMDPAVSGRGSALWLKDLRCYLRYCVHRLICWIQR